MDTLRLSYIKSLQNKLTFQNVLFLFMYDLEVQPKKCYKFRFHIRSLRYYPFAAPEFTPSIFSFMCMFGRSLFVLLYFFVWPICWLFVFDIWILITLLVSSNSFHDTWQKTKKFLLAVLKIVYNKEYLLVQALFIFLCTSLTISDTSFKPFLAAAR